MSGLARDKYLPLLERDLGNINSPIWLLINPKYPTVINEIWRHVLDEIQDKVYRAIESRIDNNNIYIRSVVSDCGIVPNSLNWWSKEVAVEIKLLRELILEYDPKMLISFGGFPFEFLRRVFEIKPQKGPRYWSAAIIEDEFDKSLKKFDMNHANIIPLVRRVGSRERLIEKNNCFSSNDKEEYFLYAGAQISEKLIQHKESLKIWI